MLSSTFSFLCFCFSDTYPQVTLKTTRGKLFESLDALKLFSLLLCFLENGLLDLKLFSLKKLKIVFHLCLHLLEIPWEI